MKADLIKTVGIMNVRFTLDKSLLIFMFLCAEVVQTIQFSIYISVFVGVG